MTTSIYDPLSQSLPVIKSRTQRTRAQKKALVEQFHTSGLTKTAFCKQNGIATSCLSRWQKGLAVECPADAFVDITAPVRAAAAPRPEPHDPPAWQVELELGAGVILRVRTG
jgi:hypothetical protein